MAIAATYTETDIENGVLNIVGVAVDKLDSNIGLLILISIFTIIVTAVTGFISTILLLGKINK